jgi:acyl-CoA thioester hydrolase
MVKTDIRVIYGDTDQMGVVYYANYLRYFEAGRNEYLRAIGVSYRDVEREMGITLPVVEAHVDYKQPARYDDLLVVETTLARVGRASARFDYRVVCAATVVATGRTVHACLDRAGKIHKLPHSLMIRLTTEGDRPPPPPGGRGEG